MTSANDIDSDAIEAFHAIREKQTMMPTCLRPLLLLVLASTASTQESGHETSGREPERLYAIVWDNGDLYSLSTEDGSGELIGNTGLFQPTSLDLAADGYLYALTSVPSPINPKSELYRIDPKTAVAAQVFEFTFGSLPNNLYCGLGEGALALSPTELAFCAEAARCIGVGGGDVRLFTLDLESGEAIDIGRIDDGIGDPIIFPLSLNSMVWRSDGLLVAVADDSPSDLVTVDPASGNVTALVSFDFFVGFVGGMATVGGEGFFANGNRITPPHELWRFDLFTGQHSLVGTTPIDGTGLERGISGLAPRTRLSVDVDSISLSEGGTQHFRFAAPESPGEIYFLLGSMSDTYPGTEIQDFLIPLNRDPYWFLTKPGPHHGGPLVHGMGFLDENGLGTAELVVPPGLHSGLSGTTLHHALVVVDRHTFKIRHVTNPVPLTLGD